MEVSRPGVESELPTYTTATAMWDPSHVYNLHHSLWQRWILNPLSEARIESLSSWILVRLVTSYHWTTMGTPHTFFFFWLHSWHAEVPGSGIKPMPQQWQHWILNLLGHQGTPIHAFCLCSFHVFFFFFFVGEREGEGMWGIFPIFIYSQQCI